MIDLHDTLEKVKKWATEVGKIQKSQLNRDDLRIEHKSTEIDLVTEVDKLSEKILIQRVNAEFPGHAILSEECGKIETDSDYCWVIDPLDGTINYAQGFPIFCISIALQYQKETVLGLVHVPVLNEMFYAIRGEGAFLNGKLLKVSSKSELNQSVLATGFPYDRAIDPQNNVELFNKIVTKVRGIRRTGSAAFDLCNVAAGRFDGYWELKLKPWDIAAGSLIVTEAHGVIIPLPEYRPMALIAANPALANLIQVTFHQS